MILAARKYNKIVQTGTQSRSSFAIKEAVEWGRPVTSERSSSLAACATSLGAASAKRKEPKKCRRIDYDLWCGPALLDPPRRNNSQFGSIHYDWHWFWDYGCGDLGNQGIHEMDRARWFLGESELSPRVFSAGGRLGYEDDGETPNTQFIFHDYAKAPLIFEVRGLPEKSGARNMDSFMGGAWRPSSSAKAVTWSVQTTRAAIAHDKDGKELKRWSGASDHYQNFINACRTRKHTDLNADIAEGFLSSSLCHTGNVSYRLGSKKAPGEIREKLQGNSAALETFGRMESHLKANGWTWRTTSSPSANSSRWTRRPSGSPTAARRTPY